MGKRERPSRGAGSIVESIPFPPLALIALAAVVIMMTTNNPLPEAQWESRVNQQVRELRVGKVMYLIPAEMETGREEKIVVRVSRQADVPPLLGGLPDRGEPKVESIKVGAFMLARLGGDGFEITPKTGEKQAVADPYSEWRWTVVPVESGDKQLDLTVAVRLKLGEGAGEEEVYLPVITRKVKVHVDPIWSTGQWLQKHEGAIVGPLAVALVIAIAGGIWAWLTRRKREGEAGFKAGVESKDKPSSGGEKGFGAAASKGKKEEKSPPPPTEA